MRYRKVELTMTNLMQRGKLLMLVVIMSIIIIPTSLVPDTAFAQAPTTQQPLPTDLQKFFDEKFHSSTIIPNPNPNSTLASIGIVSAPSSTFYGSVSVRYQGNQTIVLYGEALTTIRTPNKVFWQAVELLEHDFGYKLDKVVVNGLGSEANPERFYVIMTK